jgi:hypothetical protein
MPLQDFYRMKFVFPANFNATAAQYTLEKFSFIYEFLTAIQLFANGEEAKISSVWWLDD